MQKQKSIFIPLIIAVMLVFAGTATYFYFRADKESELNEMSAADVLQEKTAEREITAQEKPRLSSSSEVQPAVPGKPVVSEQQVGGQSTSGLNSDGQQTEPPANIKPVAAPKPETKTGQPILYNIGINLGVYDPATGMAGDILFTKAIGDHYYNKALLEFGAELTGPSGTDIMPHPTYFLPRKTKVFSPVNGKVENLRYQPESGDYEIVIVPDGFSGWRISFDHVINLLVKTGDALKTGDILAEVAQGNSSAIPPELGWFELQVWKESSSFFQPGPGAAVCPFLLLDENIKQDIASKITRLAEDWEKFLGKDVYQQEKWIFPGCLSETAQS